MANSEKNNGTEIVETNDIVVEIEPNFITTFGQKIDARRAESARKWLAKHPGKTLDDRRRSRKIKMIITGGTIAAVAGGAGIVVKIRNGSGDAATVDVQPELPANVDHEYLEEDIPFEEYPTEEFDPVVVDQPEPIEI